MRLAEARRAAETLGAVVRVTLDLPNRRLFDSFEARLALAKEFRKYRPRLVIGLGGHPLASPDHAQAGRITDAAVFYSRLSKWEDYFGALPPHNVPALLWCFLAFRQLVPERHGIVVDIGNVLEKKMAAIACYESQFPPVKAGHLDGIRAYARQQGRRPVSPPANSWPAPAPGHAGPDGACVFGKDDQDGKRRSGSAGIAASWPFLPFSSLRFLLGFLCLRSSARPPVRSVGKGASTSAASPPTGWIRRSRRAWNRLPGQQHQIVGRVAVNLAMVDVPRPPYWQSHSTGQPIWLRWTRIWRERPVFGSTEGAKPLNAPGPGRTSLARPAPPSRKIAIFLRCWGCTPMRDR